METIPLKEIHRMVIENIAQRTLGGVCPFHKEAEIRGKTSTDCRDYKEFIGKTPIQIFVES